MLQFGLIVLRIVFRIGIERRQHIVDPFTDRLIRIKRIYVKHIEFFDHRIKGIQIFSNLEVTVVTALETKECYSNQHCCQQDTISSIQKLFHTLFVKMRRKSNSLPAYSDRTSLIFNFISSQRSPGIVVPTICITFPERIEPILAHFSKEYPQVSPYRNPDAK